MALLNIFKKDKEEKDKKDKAILPKKKAAADKSKSSAVKRTRKNSQSYRILKIPHITEKASDLTKKDQYVFRVFPRANKTEIKKAVEGDYGVNVVSIKIINVRRKKKRLGKIEGMKSGYKKAIVKIKKGQKIEILPR
jgi:large subunit ribosomal protein L23